MADLHRRVVLALGVGGWALFVGLAAGRSPEFRAMWATRFNWPHPDEATCKATIDAIMDDLSGANFNVVFFQIRGQADTLYPSPYEVWSPLIGGADPGWDPLAYALNAAHARGLEFHAYINTHTCWHSYTHELPSDPNHVLWAHCNAADPNARDWLHHNQAENPAQFNAGDYVWFAPGVPAFQAYIRQQILYVVENYDVDGIHLDRTRTPSVGQPSQDPIGLARYNNPRTNPDGLSFREWTADQITRTVQDIYAAIMAVRPDVKVSAAVLYDFNSARMNQHQDALRWAEVGALDVLVPMMYYAGGQGSSWDAWLQAWLYETQASDVHIVAGHNASQGLDSLLEQVGLTRLRGAAGNSVFCWGSFWWWNQYHGNVYQDPAPLPAMPWKDSPTVGVVYGYVTDPDGLPVVDAQVRLSGRSDIALSSDDGFYSYLRVTPGSCTLTATYPAYTRVSVADVPVGAGDVVRVDIAFTEAAPPGDYNHNGIADWGDLSQLLFCMVGPEVDFFPEHTCLTGDADEDLDVDLADFTAFQQHFTDG